MTDLRLDEVEVRVLGALMEKEAATPDYYPLSLNALVAACNQKTSRDPVLSLGEDAVLAAIDRLCARGLALDISGAEHRVHKYAHRLGEVFNLDRREYAVLCLLLLRGPQTAGELRGRADRLYTFDDIASLETALGRLAERTPPLAAELPRRPGEKEPRHVHLLSGPVEPRAPAPASPAVRSSPLEDRVSRLEADLEELRRQFDQFRRGFE
ncbi:MAG: YceH family protein [Bryobacterales bacterium]|nr:YceH family protein [Bryobacterales bacterium]